VARSKNVFINIPYDPEYEKLYLALIAGLSGLGLTPRCTTEIQATKNRLERITELIKNCHYSLHDLSRVDVSGTAPKVPRFNMPFEAGLAVAYQIEHPSKHIFRILEAKPHRLQKSLSDLNGFDPEIHGNTIKGMMVALTNIFVKPGGQPGVEGLQKIYRDLSAIASKMTKSEGIKDLYSRGAFSRLVVAARESAEVRGFKF
jgi:hypothetical protein